MGWLNINGNWIGRNRGGGISCFTYWTHQTEVLFFGLYSEIADGKMPNKVSGSTDYLTVAGTAGNETFQCPDTAAYIAADTDEVWFEDSAARTVTTADLIGFDFVRTIVKYDSDTPYAIDTIMILSSDISEAKTSKLYKNFLLSLYWSGVWSDYGYLKGNKGLHYVPWDGYNSEELLKTHETYNFVANIATKWIPSGTNTFEQDGTAVKMTYVDNSTAGSMSLRYTTAGTLDENLSVGDEIKLVVKVKGTGGGGDYVKGRIGDTNGWGEQKAIYDNNDFTELTFYHTLTHYQVLFKIDTMNASESAYVEFISLKKKI